MDQTDGIGVFRSRHLISIWELVVGFLLLKLLLSMVGLLGRFLLHDALLVHSSPSPSCIGILMLLVVVKHWSYLWLFPSKFGPRMAQWGVSISSRMAAYYGLNQEHEREGERRAEYGDGRLVYVQMHSSVHLGGVLGPAWILLGVGVTAYPPFRDLFSLRFAENRLDFIIIHFLLISLRQDSFCFCLGGWYIHTPFPPVMCMYSSRLPIAWLLEWGWMLSPAKQRRRQPSES